MLGNVFVTGTVPGSTPPPAGPLESDCSESCLSEYCYIYQMQGIRNHWVPWYQSYHAVLSSTTQYPNTSLTFLMPECWKQCPVSEQAALSQRVGINAAANIPPAQCNQGFNTLAVQGLSLFAHLAE